MQFSTVRPVPALEMRDTSPTSEEEIMISCPMLLSDCGPSTSWRLVMLIMRREVAGLSTRIVVLVTWVAKLNPEAQVCLAIRNI